MSGSGRPKKYHDFIRELDAHTIYAPYTITLTGQANGLFNKWTDDHEILRTKVRHAMSRLSKNHHFPKAGDGIVELKGKVPAKGWYGWRWQETLPDFFLQPKALAEIRQLREEYDKLTPSTEAVTPKRIYLQSGFQFGQDSPEKSLPQAKSRWRLPFSNNRWKGVVLGCLALLSAGAVGSLWTFSTEGLRLIREEGPREAQAWLQKTSLSQPNDPQVEFGRIWSTYSIGKIKDAERECHLLIDSPELPKNILANCFYLLGNIYNRTGRQEDAEEAYGKALQIYEPLESYGNMHKTVLGLAEVALEREQLIDAHELLEESLFYQAQSDKDLAHYFALMARSAFLEGDFGLALVFSRNRLEEARRENLLNETADAHSDVGFFLILTGALSEGFDQTLIAQEIIHRTGDDGKFHANSINFLVFKRCQGLDTQELAESIKAKIEYHGNRHLNKFIDFALNFNCSNFRPHPIGEGDENPPDFLRPQRIGEGDENPPDFLRPQRIGEGDENPPDFLRPQRIGEGDENPPDFFRPQRIGEGDENPPDFFRPQPIGEGDENPPDFFRPQRIGEGDENPPDFFRPQPIGEGDENPPDFFRPQRIGEGDENPPDFFRPQPIGEGDENPPDFFRPQRIGEGDENPPDFFRPQPIEKPSPDSHRSKGTKKKS